MSFPALHFLALHLTFGRQRSMMAIKSEIRFRPNGLNQIDEDIEQRLRRVDQIQRDKGPSPLAARLKAKGLL